ncbi:MAG: hypothetical protein J5955_06565 [Bacilli bacterium]|nr:hypothetical protein [Bacilli bacterium]
MKKRQLLPLSIFFALLLYFSTLLAERTISVVQSIVNGVDLFGTPFNIFTYLLVFLSIAGWLVFLLVKCRDSIKALFKPSEEVNFKPLCIASGILLLSGMVHTEYTISVMQFVAYGILIVGILLKVIENSKTSENKPLLWLSFTYLVAFSMAIPVMYHSNIEHYKLFHVIEGISVFALVGLFTYLLVKIFDGKNDLFMVVPIVVAIALDVPLIILRWNEEVNVFVLIFISLSTLLYVAGIIVKFIQKRKVR